MKHQISKLSQNIQYVQKEKSYQYLLLLLSLLHFSKKNLFGWVSRQRRSLRLYCQHFTISSSQSRMSFLICSFFYNRCYQHHSGAVVFSSTTNRHIKIQTWLLIILCLCQTSKETSKTPVEVARTWRRHFITSAP